MILTMSFDLDETEEVVDNRRPVYVSEQVNDIEDVLSVIQEALDASGLDIPEGYVVALVSEDD